jgi:hypothetical protein
MMVSNATTHLTKTLYSFFSIQIGCRNPLLFGRIIVCPIDVEEQRLVS